jgi:hypothetical protein
VRHCCFCEVPCMLLFDQRYNNEFTKRLVRNSFVPRCIKPFGSAAEVHTAIDVGGGSAHCRAALSLALSLHPPSLHDQQRVIPPHLMPRGANAPFNNKTNSTHFSPSTLPLIPNFEPFGKHINHLSASICPAPTLQFLLPSESFRHDLAHEDHRYPPHHR